MKQRLFLFLLFLGVSLLPVVGLSSPINNARAVCMLLQDNPQSSDIRNGLKDILPEIKEKELQHHLMAIYMLNSLYAGDSGTAQGATSWLMKNNADADLLVRLTARNLSEPCSTCEGSGESSIECRKCKGRRVCSSCDGKGQKEFSLTEGSFKCQLCSGSGKCNGCNGSGTETKTCSDCGGKKSRFSADKVRDTMSAFIKEFLEMTKNVEEKAAAAEVKSPAPDKPSAPDKAPAPPAESGPEGLMLSALLDAFSGGDGSAYQNKTLILRDARVQEADSDGFGGTYLLVKPDGNNGQELVYCSFPAGFKRVSPKVGQEVVIQGTCAGKQGKYISFDNCRLLPN
jgi:hypothetical protein